MYFTGVDAMSSTVDNTVSHLSYKGELGSQ